MLNNHYNALYAQYGADKVPEKIPKLTKLNFFEIPILYKHIEEVIEDTARFKHISVYVLFHALDRFNTLQHTTLAYFALGFIAPCNDLITREELSLIIADRWVDDVLQKIHELERKHYTR